MIANSVLCSAADAARRVGASDVFVYRRAGGGAFVLTSPVTAPAAEELLLDDEPLVVAALRSGVQRVAGEEPRRLCAGYIGRAAAVVAVDVDVVVVLGRRDGCLAGVADDELVSAACVAAGVPTTD
jgi:hypothetical protein